MKNDKVKDLMYKVFAYSIIYICINLYMINSDAFLFESWYYIGNIASASIVYLIIFLGKESVNYRLSDSNKWKPRLNQMTISKQGIIFHAIVIVTFVSIVLFMGKI